MRSLRAWLIRFFGLFDQSTREQELADEIETNLQLHIEDNLRSGMTPEEARRAALVTFGGLDAAKEACRDRRGIPSIATIPQDVRYALRMLGQNKGWATVAVLSLALGIGANSALFSIVNTYALRKLPVPDPDELVGFRWYGDNNLQNQGSDDAYIARSPGESAGSGFTFAALQEFRNSNQTLSGIFAFARAGSLNVFANGRAEFASGQFVTGNFYTELGGSAVAGRTLTAEDDSPEAEPVVVISHAYWQRRFAMDGGTVGSSLTIDGMPFTVVGITQPGFVDPTRRGFPSAPDISIPLSMEPRVRQKVSWLNVPAIWWLMVVGRLKPGITAEQAQANFSGVFDGLPGRIGTALSPSCLRKRERTPNLAGVNEAFVRTFSRDTSPVGRRFATQPRSPAGIEIVGVVADVKVNSLRQSAPPLFFRPITQVGMPYRTVVVRTAEDAKALLPAIQEAMQKIDPRLPLRNVSTQMDQISMNYLLHERIFAFSALFFGGLALAVAMIGLFGLMSYSVARRTKEIGIRMALGAKRQDVLSSVMRESLRLVGLGVLVGLPAALILTRLLSSLLFGLAPHDPATLGIAVFLMLTVSVLAGYLPARRAARVDLMVALRYE